MAKDKQFIPGIRTPQDNKAIRDAAQEFMGDGYPPEQAIAIAFRKWGDNELQPALVPVLTGEAEEYNNSIREERIKSTNRFDIARRSAIARYKQLVKLRMIKDKSK